MALKWLLVASGVLLIAAGSLLASLIQTSGGIQVRDVRFGGVNGTMSGLLYVPSNATERTPAPGIMAVHGLINSREMQDGFAIEFARRGYVVLALDMTGHGYSEPPMSVPELGGPDGLEYLRGLPFVDKNNIGLEGHSLGGMAILSAAVAHPDDYRALILVGSTTGTPQAGTPVFPHNAAFVLGAFDEFTPTMWGTKAFYDPNEKRQEFLARDVGTSRKLQAIFGTASTVLPGTMFGDPKTGMARELYIPAVSHPAEHISIEAIGDAADWFGKTLRGGTPRPFSDQIWYWKEAGTGLAFLGFIILILVTFDLLLLVPYFADLGERASPSWPRRDVKWWIGFGLSVLIPGLVFLPTMIAAQLLLPPMPGLPQVYTNQVLAWAFATLGLLALLRIWLKGERGNFTTHWLSALFIAPASVGAGYLALLAMDAVFHVDFRLWILALKPMSSWQFDAFLIYIVPFAVYFLGILTMLQDMTVRGDGAFKQYAVSIVAMAGGIALFLAAEYLPLLLSDHLLVPMDPLHPIIAIQFVPVLAIVGIISTYTWRRTNSPVPGALMSALFVTWYVCAGTATMFPI